MPDVNNTPKILKWSEEDPRDISSSLGSYSIRVRAEHHGTVWVAYIEGPNFNWRSEHVSKDAAKQKAAKVVRSVNGKD